LVQTNQVPALVAHSPNRWPLVARPFLQRLCMSPRGGFTTTVNPTANADISIRGMMSTLGRCCRKSIQEITVALEFEIMESGRAILRINIARADAILT